MWIENLLNAGDRGRLVTHPDRLVQRLVLDVAQRLTEIVERGFEAPGLLRERLKRRRLRRSHQAFLGSERADGRDNRRAEKSVSGRT